MALHLDDLEFAEIAHHLPYYMQFKKKKQKQNYNSYAPHYILSNWSLVWNSCTIQQHTNSNDSIWQQFSQQISKSIRLMLWCAPHFTLSYTFIYLFFFKFIQILLFNCYDDYCHWMCRLVIISIEWICNEFAYRLTWSVYFVCAFDVLLVFSFTYHSITTSKHDLPLYVFSKTSTILTIWRHPLAAQCKSTSRLAFGLSCNTLSAYFWLVARLVHWTTLPLMPRPRTVFEISYVSVIGVDFGCRDESFDALDCIADFDMCGANTNEWFPFWFRLFRLLMCIQCKE